MAAIRAALFDVDGVLAFPPEFLSQYYGRVTGYDPTRLEQLLVDNAPNLRSGSVNLQTLLVDHPEVWSGVSDITTLLDAWLATSGARNEPLLTVIQTLRRSGLPCYAATNQDSYRGDYLKQRVFADVLDGCFISADIRIMKPEPAYFQRIIADLRVAPEEVVFFDDVQANVTAAQATGLAAYLFTGVPGVISALSAVGIPVPDSVT